MKKLIAIFLLTLTTACSVFGGKAAEEPKFTIIETDGEFELREYASYVTAETFVDADYEESTSEAFSRLFDYITGDNQGDKNISMTAPVLQEPVSIAMTAPVLQEKSDKGWNMAFVLPDEFTIDNAPKPTNEDVRIVEIPEKKIAVVTYNGSLAEDNIKENLQKLRSWLADKGYKYSEDYKSAGYNPPWTIPYFRRNEVMIELKD